MKRLLAALLILCLCIPMLSCRAANHKEPVDLYYARKEIDFESDSPVIASEVREGYGYASNPSGIICEYLKGPESEDLYSPIPKGTQLVSVSFEDQILKICLSDSLASLSGLELSLSCVCMGLTLLELTDATEIQIYAENEMLDGEEWISITADTLLLMEPVIPNSN